MKTYSVLFAEDVPHYGSVEIEAENDAGALDAARGYDLSEVTTDPEWENSVCRRIVHIEDAAFATVAGLECAPGAYNIVDDHPSQQRVWLPAFARACGAPEPLQITEQEALATSGADSVYYATRVRGASNEKARHELTFRPRPLEWLQARAVPAQHG